jgi:hypothetical protein
MEMENELQLQRLRWYIMGMPSVDTRVLWGCALHLYRPLLFLDHGIIPTAPMLGLLSGSWKMFSTQEVSGMNPRYFINNVIVSSRPHLSQ